MRAQADLHASSQPPAPPSEKEPETLARLLFGVGAMHGGDLSYKERKFVVDMVRRAATGYKPTEKQAEWLRPSTSGFSGGTCLEQSHSNSGRSSRDALGLSGVH